MNLALLGGLVFAAVIAFALVMVGINIYNSLISLRNQVDRSWSNIDVLLKQRNDEIPNLVSVCEQFAGYERATLDRLMQARTRYGNAGSMDEKVKAANEVSLALKGLFALGEAYPELKSSEHFLELQRRISALEDALADRRELFNESATNFNTRIQQIPDVFFANMLAYRPLELFRALESERAMPSVKMKLPAA